MPREFSRCPQSAVAHSSLGGELPDLAGTKLSTPKEDQGLCIFSVKCFERSGITSVQMETRSSS